MSLPRPPPTYDAGAYSSLTNEDASGQSQPYYRANPARRHTVQATQGMGRQSMLVFSDFNSFESPRGSRSGPSRSRDDDEDYEFDPDFKPEFDPLHDEKKFGPESTYSLEKNLPDPPYHVFTLAKKKQMVYIVSLAGLFSPLSSNIYFPALGQISRVCPISTDMLSGHH